MDPYQWNPFTATAAIAASLPLITWAGSLLWPRAALWQKGALVPLGASFLLAIGLLLLCEPGAVWGSSTHWIDIGTAGSRLVLTAGLRLDGLATAMLAMVAGISWLVHLFSLAYLRHDPGLTRYLGYLGFFTAAMMWLVLADNLLTLFVCWELVGFASWLLIGFWREEEAPARAAQQAFIVNRVGDAGFLIGILILIAGTGTLDLAALPDRLGMLTPGWQLAAALCLFVGVAGKSAQFPLQGWLPAAMEGPTPVSALIHAATMVAAGVYLLARVSFLLPPVAGTVVAVVGALTALMAALSALTQWDIKRVLAFSTISQLGFMVLGIGVGARDMALLHLFTHAFFKSALFLGAGAVIHAVHSQDMRQMGGLARSMPRLFGLYLVPALALSGLPLFSGFLSKDGILVGAVLWANELGGLAWLVPVSALFTSFLTALYMGRQLWLVFGGESRGAVPHPALEAKMFWPLLLLAIMSLWLPFGWHPGHPEGSWWLALWSAGDATTTTHAAWVPPLSVLLAGAGLGLAWWQRRNWLLLSWEGRPGRMLSGHFGWERWYHAGVAAAAFWLSRAAAWVDRTVIDGSIHLFTRAMVNHRGGPSVATLAERVDDHLIDGAVNGIAKGVLSLGKRLRSLHRGKVQDNLWLGLLLLGLLMWVLWG